MTDQGIPTLLIVDDSMDEQRMLIELLRTQQFAFVVAFDGQQGYQRAIASRPDLILLDIRMPRTDGFAACRLLKSNPVTQNIPIIFLSSANTPEERIHGLTLGGVDYVSKPFVPGEVLARIRIHLNLTAKTPAAMPVSKQLSPSNLDEVMVAAVTRLVSDQLAVPLSLAEIAGKVGTYEKKLSQVFREQTGLTVFAFIRHERIRRARHLLAETGMDVQDIADYVGFQNAASFATAFREHMGMTPSAYRQAVQSSGNKPNAEIQ